MSIGKRLKLIIEKKSLTKNSFSVGLGIHNTMIGNVTRERNKPSYEFIRKILAEHRDINARWLITGEGEYPINEETSMAHEDQASYGKNETETLYWKTKFETCSELIIKMKEK